jgi:hypothetical protein
MSNKFKKGYSHGNGVITKKLENRPELAPKLIVSVKKLSEKKYYISIIHPNTKEILYEKNHLSRSYEDAFKLAKSLKEKFSDVSTWAEEILFIPRPKRGKMKLNIKEEKEDDQEEQD